MQLFDIYFVQSAKNLGKKCIIILFSKLEGYPTHYPINKTKKLSYILLFSLENSNNVKEKSLSKVWFNFQIQEQFFPSYLPLPCINTTARIFNIPHSSSNQTYKKFKKKRNTLHIHFNSSWFFQNQLLSLTFFFPITLPLLIILTLFLGNTKCS
jgi:hypothetical protein